MLSNLSCDLFIGYFTQQIWTKIIPKMGHSYHNPQGSPGQGPLRELVTPGQGVEDRDTNVIVHPVVVRSSASIG